MYVLEAMIDLFWIRLPIVLVAMATAVALGPWFVRWLRHARPPILVEFSGWILHLPHLLMAVHSVVVVFLIFGIEPLSILPGSDHIADNETTALAGPVGVMLFLLGNIIRVWAMLAQGAGLEKDLRVREDNPLITDGPYTFARHPIYTGNLMAELGLGLAFAYWPLLALTILFSAPAWYYRAKREEAMLLVHYGERYREYMARVRMFLPW